MDHFVLDEVEETFAEFLRDLESGTAKRLYREARKPDVTRTPVPRFDLIDIKNYAMMSVQFSRGCPFDCEFCDIIKLYGRVPRTKSPEQVVEELDSLYRLGWRGPVFLVDDNFIGNKRDALELLPAIAGWQKARGYPFTLITEASANLALMDAMMDAMIEAGFDSVFVGIETPNPKALLKTKKQQNTNETQENYLYHAVRKIQQRGMQVQGGFILGLDSDDEGVFDAQIDFIQETGIPVAPIYLLTAVKGTDMYERMKSEGRLLEAPLGTNAMPLNFKDGAGIRHIDRRIQAGDRHALRPDPGELLQPLPDPVQAPEACPASSKAQEQDRDRCGLHGRSQSSFRQAAPRLFEVRRQGLQGLSGHAFRRDLPCGHGVSLRKDQPSADRNP